MNKFTLADDGSSLHCMIRIGVDFGDTKIEVAALDAAGNFLARVRAPNPGRFCGR